MKWTEQKPSVMSEEPSEENVKSLAESTTFVDVEKNAKTAAFSPDNNHFFDEKAKERTTFGINGSSLVLYGLFFAVFTIGWININRCPLNRLIPVYLILAGLLGALIKCLWAFHNKYCSHINMGLIIINIVWHGIGTYAVYKEYQPSYEPKDPLYCNRTTYLVAFWTLTIEYTMLLFFLLLSGCYMLMRRDFRTESGTK